MVYNSSVDMASDTSTILIDDNKWVDAQGRLHRDDDQPALIWGDGTQFWFQHGELHRDGDQPAWIWADGSQFWYQYDKHHRDGNQPATIWPDGSYEWWEHGIRMSEAIIYARYQKPTLILIELMGWRLPADVTRFLITTFI